MRKFLLISVIFLTLIILGVTQEYATAREGVNQTIIKNKIKHIIKDAKIIGIEKSPIDKLYIVFLDLKGKRGALMISEDGNYIIVGNMLDVKNPMMKKNVIFELGKRKGYFKKQPRVKKIDPKKITKYEERRFGNKNSPEIVIFLDPDCPFCKRELIDLFELKRSGKIAFYVKYFIVHGEPAKERAKKAECIKEKLGEEAYLEYIIKGKKPSQMPKCDYKKIEEMIDKDQQEALALGIRGTPTTIIGNDMYTGYIGKNELVRLIDKKQKNKLKSSK